MSKVILYEGEKLYSYGFPKHILTSNRYKLFWNEMISSSLAKNNNLVIKESKPADIKILSLFHDKNYIDYVKKLSLSGKGYLDHGDTPAYKGMFDIALHAVGATLDAVLSIIDGEAEYAFNPAGGFHHAERDRGAGFCIFNDVCIAIEYILKRNLVDSVYYIDIDAHHGNSVYYHFEDNPKVYIFDVHESGKFLYPGTGYRWERGKGDAIGTKINISLLPGADDEDLINAINRAYKFGLSIDPDIIILQAGADGISGDPITHLNYSFNGYAKAVKMIRELSDNTCRKLVVLGGGGYESQNVSRAWVLVLKILLRLI